MMINGLTGWNEKNEKLKSEEGGKLLRRGFVSYEKTKKR
jgi:hypothetical protein